MFLISQLSLSILPKNTKLYIFTYYHIYTFIKISLYWCIWLSHVKLKEVFMKKLASQPIMLIKRILFY